MPSRVTASSQAVARRCPDLPRPQQGALVTTPHDPEHTATSNAEDETTEVPLPQEPAPPRRWSRGHTIAAAVVAMGALVAGGAAPGGHHSDPTRTPARAP